MTISTVSTGGVKGVVTGGVVVGAVVVADGFFVLPQAVRHRAMQRSSRRKSRRLKSLSGKKPKIFITSMKNSSIKATCQIADVNNMK